jgi:hypothetical protein
MSALKAQMTKITFLRFSLKYWNHFHSSKIIEHWVVSGAGTQVDERKIPESESRMDKTLAWPFLPRIVGCSVAPVVNFLRGDGMLPIIHPTAGLNRPPRPQAHHNNAAGYTTNRGIPWAFMPE